MVSQSCPRCKSERIRRGYRPTPIWSKILFRLNLLCDDCNWEFMGFAVPGTIGTKPTKRIRKLKIEKKHPHAPIAQMSEKEEDARENNQADVSESSGDEKNILQDKKAKKKELKSSFEQ